MHRYYQAEKAPFREMTDGLLQQYSAACLPVRMVFFGAVAAMRNMLPALPP